MSISDPTSQVRGTRRLERTTTRTKYQDMKIAAATILSALAFSSLVSAVPAKRDGLKCQAKYAPGPLAARAHFGSATERQYFAFRGVEGREGEVLATSDKPGQEVQFYECEKPAEKYNPDKDGGYHIGLRYHFGQLRLKEDPSQCVTVGTDRKMRLEKCEERATKKMEEQWMAVSSVGEGCASIVWHAPTQDDEWEGQVGFTDDAIELSKVTRGNIKSAVAFKMDNGAFGGRCAS